MPGMPFKPRQTRISAHLAIYSHEVTIGRLDGDVDVRRHVAETADRLLDRLAVIASGIERLLEDHIPELAGNSRVVELLGASVEGNVELLLHGDAVLGEAAPA
jgi:hypothetical protein